MKANYDLIARYYDSLSKFIYGNAIINAQCFLVNFIPANSAVLIVGGGTGYILEEIAKKHTEGLEITYVENSVKMLQQSEKRSVANNKIHFISQSITNVIFDEQFDIVLTPFLLDNFSNATTRTVFNKLDASLKLQGLWLFADFEIEERKGWWQKVLLKVMYLFFRFICGIEASELPDTSILFAKAGYSKIATKKYFSDFICSYVYQKANGE